jgi:uncharacterized membrane protein YsdA (DUF1294 family)
MCYYLGFGVISLLMAGLLYPFIYNNTTWNPYAVWVSAWSITAFFIYSFDWVLTKMGNVRTPNAILYVLSALGGFPGAWLGLIIFQGKKKFLKNVWLFVVFGLSTVGHGLLTYHWFVNPLVK